MKPLAHSPRPQRGMALITAILIAALVSSLAFALSARERLWLTLVGNRNDLAAAQSIALSAIDLARLTLRDDMRSNQVDHLLEAWTVPVPPINVEEGRAAGRLGEMQGRFNLFNLQSGGQPSKNAIATLQRLLAARNMPTEWADPIAQAMVRQVALWQKALVQNSKTRQSISKIFPVANLTELGELCGIDPEKLGELDPLVTILPETTSINVNFAPPEVLMATVPGLSLKEAENLVSRRTTAHFKSSQDFVNALPEKLRTAARSAGYTVESQYFFSEAEAWYGRAHLRLRALLYRQRGRMPEIIWVRRE